MEIPVYLFTGFLGAGKTSFIQQTLEDERFNRGERTLLVVCEDGEEEYAPDRFSGANVFIRMVESEEELNGANLSKWRRETRAERVLIEYNGMWLLDRLYTEMPRDWTVYQEFSFAEASTYVVYNANMRNLVVDKLKSCELIVFGRADESTDKDAIHKIVRGVTRRADIAYEYTDGSVEYDDIVDPLPFDKDAPVIVIEDRDYALFYRDLSEEMESYEAKTVQFKGMVATSAKLPRDCFIIGRQVMTCCVEDIQFAGLVCQWPDSPELKKGDWVTVTAEFHNMYHKAYGKVGPVLTASEVSHALRPEDPVATFY